LNRLLDNKSRYPRRPAGARTEPFKRLAQSQPGAFIHWSLGILS
jgi:hypothetical protein